MTANEQLNETLTNPTTTKWNDTALGRCGRYHEAQAQILRTFMATCLAGSTAQLERDMEMHTEFMLAARDAQ